MTAENSRPDVSEIESARTVVYPWHCDWMGHFATQHYMKIFDDAIGHLLGSIGYRFTDASQTQCGWADVSHTIEYRHELVAGDLVVAYSGIERVGTKSLGYFHRLVRATEPETICARLRGVVVHFDLAQRRAIALPHAMRSAASARMCKRPPEEGLGTDG